MFLSLERSCGHCQCYPILQVYCRRYASAKSIRVSSAKVVSTATNLSSQELRSGAEDVYDLPAESISAAQEASTPSEISVITAKWAVFLLHRDLPEHDIKSFDNDQDLRKYFLEFLADNEDRELCDYDGVALSKEILCAEEAKLDDINKRVLRLGLVLVYDSMSWGVIEVLRLRE